VTTVLVTGTGTDVGKTWVAAEVLARLRARGVPVAARKPAQSYAPDELGATDAELLAAASGERPEVVCAHHRWYPVPMAPPMAAEALGLPPFTIEDLVTEVTPAHPAALMLVEGAGGPRSPLAADGDTVDLARALGIRAAVLVADAGLGTINAVRLSIEALRGLAVVVALNRFDPGDSLHRRNLAWLGDGGIRVVTDPAAVAESILV
jgi:dethiobiotin synthetase